MLANPRHSRLVLINPGREEPGGTPAGLLARRRESLSLLQRSQEIFGIALDVAGEPQIDLNAVQPDELFRVVDLDALSLWHDPQFTGSLAASEIGVIFLGGAWLEEDVLLAALAGVKLGYDVRLLADLSIARVEDDRDLALDRLALHGVPVMTVRQAMLEWAMYLEDPILKRKVQQLLA